MYKAFAHGHVVRNKQIIISIQSRGFNMALNIFGFKISHKGITLPFSNIRIPIPLILPFIFLATETVTPVRADTFPSDGTFKQQDDFIKSLPPTCPTDISTAMTDLVNAQNPFAHMKTMRTDLNVNVIRHEFDSTYGVVTRRMAASEGNSNTDRRVIEQEQVFIGGEGDGSKPLTFVFERTPEGNLKPVKREAVPVATYAAGIEDARKNEGIIVNIKTPHEDCYQSRRPGS